MFFAFKPPYAVLSSRASARKKKFQCSHFVSYNLADPYSDWEERVGVVGTEWFQALYLSSRQNQNRGKRHMLQTPLASNIRMRTVFVFFFLPANLGI